MLQHVSHMFPPIHRSPENQPHADSPLGSGRVKYRTPAVAPAVACISLKGGRVLVGVVGALLLSSLSMPHGATSRVALCFALLRIGLDDLLVYTNGNSTVQDLMQMGCPDSSAALFLVPALLNNAHVLADMCSVTFQGIVISPMFFADFHLLSSFGRGSNSLRGLQ